MALNRKKQLASMPDRINEKRDDSIIICIFVLQSNPNRQMDDHPRQCSLLLFVLLILLSGCKKAPEPLKLPASEVQISYATGFSINHYDTYTQVTVKSPWDSSRILHTYILIDRNKAIPKSHPDGTIVKVPVQNVACLYCIHVGILEQLGKLANINAVAEPEFINIPAIQEGIQKKSIRSLGIASSIDIEQLMEAAPELVFAAPFEGMGYGNMGKCGIPIAEDASYMEGSPLGRAEWIKFIAAFMGEEEKGNQIFESIEKRYNSLKDLTKEASHPTVFAEKRYGQVWYVPGGQSYMGQLFADAGLNYLWKETPETGSLALSPESVFEKAENSDFWVIKDADRDRNKTYQAFAAENDSYKYFKAWQKRKIIYTNTTYSGYYEKGILQPDALLADLIHLVHPELLPDYQPIYFQMMEEK